MTDISDTISEVAAAPQETQTDEGRVKERSLKELIDADRHVQSNAAESAPWGARIAKAIPRGSV